MPQSTLIIPKPIQDHLSRLPEEGQRKVRLHLKRAEGHIQSAKRQEKAHVDVAAIHARHQEQIDRIEAASSVKYWIVIVAALFKDVFDPGIAALSGVVTTAVGWIPIVGQGLALVGMALSNAFSMVFSLLFTGFAATMYLIARAEEPVKSHGRVYYRMLLRIFLISMAFFIDGLIPVINILPITSIVACLVLLDVNRERKKAIEVLKQQEKETLERYVSLEA